MKKWFCHTEELSSVIKMAAYDAGYLVTKNNKDLIGKILPVTDGILKTIEAGTSQEVVNAIFKESVEVLLTKVDPIVAASIALVLTQANFNVGEKKDPQMKVDVIKGLVEAFTNGAKLVK